VPKGNIKRSDISKGILASIQAVARVVEAIAIGKINVELPSNSNHRVTRFAPHFAVGLGKDEQDSIPYTVRHVSEIIGSTYAYRHLKNPQASRWIRLAFEFLEGVEAGYVDETWITDIQKEKYTMQSLHKALRAAKMAHEVFSKTAKLYRKRASLKIRKQAA
jgi:hypothetical protein